MRKSSLAIAVASLLSYTSFSHAQENSSDIETMVVTANRFEQLAGDTIVPVEVITKEDIDSIQAKSLTEVLARLPGVQISGNGGYGQTQNVYVRGTNSSHVLMLMNGVRMGSATLGSGNFGSIPLTGIERIEFVRGSRAAVYGADAVGGVINIITEYKEGQDYSEVSLGAGSDNYLMGKVSSIGKLTDDLWGKVAINAENSDGFSSSSVSGQEDDDGFKNRDIVLELGGYINSQWLVKATAYYHDGYVEFDNPEASNKDVRITNFAGISEYSGDNFSSTLTVATNTDREENFDTGYDGTIQTDRDTINWQNLYRFNSNYALGGGIDWYNIDISETTNSFDKTEQSNVGYYVTGMYEGEVLLAEANVRSDDNEEYGVNNTWQAGLAWTPRDRYRFGINGGTAFKAPSFNDLYYPTVCYGTYGCFGGNSDLKPEESKNVELSAEAMLSVIDLRLAFYQQDISNLIVWGNTPENVSEARIQGVELVANFETGAFYHNVILEYMNPEDRDTGKQLIRRSKESAKWNLNYLSGNWQLDTSLLYRGKAFDDTDNTEELDSYTLVDIAASYFVSDNITVRARIANVFDKDYVVAKDFNTAERSYYATVTYQF